MKKKNVVCGGLDLCVCKFCGVVFKCKLKLSGHRMTLRCLGGGSWFEMGPCVGWLFLHVFRMR